MLEGWLGRVSWQEELGGGCGEKRSYLTSFLLSFKDITLKAHQSAHSQLQEVFARVTRGLFSIKKKLYQIFWNAVIQGCNKTHCYTFSCETDSCAFRVWLCCSQDFCSCFKLPTALSKKLTLATWNKITWLSLNHPGFSLTQFDFRSHGRWSYSYARKLEESKKIKPQPTQFESVHNSIIIYGTPTVLLQPGVRIESARTLSFLSCWHISTHASAPHVWNLLRNQTALKLCSKSSP